MIMITTLMFITSRLISYASHNFPLNIIHNAPQATTLQFRGDLIHQSILCSVSAGVGEPGRGSGGMGQPYELRVEVLSDRGIEGKQSGKC